MYQVKEIFYTLQGEGAHSGRPAVFMRFSGCNLWTGREVDRGTAQCQFCDTDFVGVDGENGGKYKTAEELALKAQLVATGLGKEKSEKIDGLLIVLTGGEPLLQVDEPLIEALHAQGFEIAIETNGTIKAPDGLDWICVSPKAGTEIVQRSGNELKLVYGQDGIDPVQFEDWAFDHFYLQPMDTLRVSSKRSDYSQINIHDETDSLTDQVIAYCKAHPKWKLSLQTHKILNIACGATCPFKPGALKKLGLDPSYSIKCEHKAETTMLIFKEFTFEAAHFLPSAEKGTANSRIHGHSFRVRVTLKGAPADDTGLIQHLGVVEEKLKAVHDKLDHRFLNEDVEGLEYPTLEHIALWIWGELHIELPLIYEVSVMRDTCGEGCIYRGSQHKKGAE